MNSLIPFIVLVCFNIYYYVNYIKDYDKTKHESFNSKIEAHDFKLIQLGSMRRDQYLLDRKTGRIWEIICYGKQTKGNCEGQLLWQEMHVQNRQEGSAIKSLGINNLRKDGIKTYQVSSLDSNTKNEQ